jgi:asparagine synthase (glutamine-hydrolysing)
MCGIAGILGAKGSIEEMVKALYRRGPDDAGIWKHPNGFLALGHARLSIIDLSEGGHQPMLDELNKNIIVFNGEIFNYLELKNELQQFGHTFQTKSDTEVILVAWRQWGEACVSKFRGMFAFAIWEHKEQTLSLVRDRLGIKPILYAYTEGNLIFASSMSAILASGEVKRALNKEGLWDLMSQGSVLQPRTLVNGVHSLLPGNILKYKNGEIKNIRAYWELEAPKDLSKELQSLDYSALVKRLRIMLETACSYHMIADVPIGSFLSGGVDSSVITAIMAKLSRTPIQSFSIGFANVGSLENELTEAAEAANFLGCDHHELILDGLMVNNHFDEFIDVVDQPSYDGINTYWVSKMASSSVKVTLSGLGGDELFAGYPHFEWPFIFSSDHKRSLFQSIYRKYPMYLARFKNAYMNRTDTFGKLATLRRLSYDSQLRKYIRPENAPYLPQEDWMVYEIQTRGFSNSLTMDTISKYECKNYLLNTLLRDADALSMGHGLEVRPIFLDHHLVEFAMACPQESKWKHNRSKAMLKDACEDLLPKGYFERSKKGFTLPTNIWLENELSERYKECLASPIASKLFNEKYLNFALPRELSKGNGLNSWLFLVLIEWMRKFKIEVNG